MIKKRIIGIALALVLAGTFIYLIKTGVLDKHGVLPIGFGLGIIVAIAFDENGGVGNEK